MPTACPQARAERGNLRAITRSFQVLKRYRVAYDTIADVDASGLWPGRVVTELVPAGPFWDAEPEHQDYLECYPNGYTCHFVRPGWKLAHRQETAGH